MRSEAAMWGQCQVRSISLKVQFVTLNETQNLTCCTFNAFMFFLRDTRKGQKSCCRCIRHLHPKTNNLTFIHTQPFAGCAEMREGLSQALCSLFWFFTQLLMPLYKYNNMNAFQERLSESVLHHPYI